MGLISWIIAGLLTFTLVRFLGAARQRWPVELAVSLGSAILGGLAATALDFGGWAVSDVRAVAFAGLISLFSIGLLRERKRRRDS